MIETPPPGDSQNLQVQPHRWTRRRRLALRVAAIGFLICFVWLAYYAVQIHSLARSTGQTLFLSADGKPMFALEDHRLDVPLDRMSPHIRAAVIAIEDRRFYTHGGIDPISIVRASLRNLQSGEVVEGASTMTQQLARLLFLSNSKSFSRKVKEAVLASMIELRLSKEKILELYLNRIYFGGDVYGVEAMSRNVYGKPASELTIAESALLAGLIHSPSTLWPWTNIEGATRRSHVVLARMREQGLITADAEKAARNEKPRILSRPGLDQGPSGYVAQFLRSEFRKKFGDDSPQGWKVYTTVVPGLQAAAERAVTDGLKRLKNSRLEAALVAIDPQSGGVLALVGGRDFGRAPFNRAVSARRQPGSAFKPFLYAAALEQGFSPVSQITNLNSFRVEGHDEWVVRNVSQEAADELTLRDAFIESDNRAAVALQTEIGSQPVIRLARSAGLGEMPNVPSLALGTGEVTPLDLTAAYAAFVNGGSAVTPHGIVRVVDEDEDVVFENEVNPHRVLSDGTAFQMVSMLEDVVMRGTGASARSLGVTFPAGGKTGTTDSFKDAWFVGFSSSVVAGVWTGLDKPAPIAGDGYGSRYALPIWAGFMSQTPRLRPPGPFVQPASVQTVDLCVETHELASRYCVSRKEYFKEGDDIPDDECGLHGNAIRRIFEGFFRGWGRWFP